MIGCGEDRAGGCLVQYLPPVMLSARLLTSAVASQTMDLSPGVTKEETSLANHCQIQLWGSSSSDSPVPPSCPPPPPKLNGLPGSLEWQGCLGFQGCL